MVFFLWLPGLIAGLISREVAEQRLWLDQVRQAERSNLSDRGCVHELADR